VARVGVGSKWALAGATGLAAFAVDMASKRAVELSLAGEVELLPFLSLETARNSGVAFGMLSGRSGLILVANLIALVLIMLYVYVESRPVVGGIAGGLLLGGSLGNIVQRAAQGQVTDFIKVSFYPTFNLADVFIFLGVVLVAISVFFAPHRPEQPRGGA